MDSTLSGVRTGTNGYLKLKLADSTKIDAHNVQFLLDTTVNQPVRFGGGADLCWSGGEVLGQLPPSTPWSRMHDTYALGVDTNRGSADIDHVRIFNYGDGVNYDSGGANWVLRHVYVKHSADDCISNDFYHSGTIDSSFFDGCFVGVSARAFKGTIPVDTASVMVIRNSLIRLQAMDGPFPSPSAPEPPYFGTFWKWDSVVTRPPKIKLYDNVFRADAHPGLEQEPRARYMRPPLEKLVDCANNTMVWLGIGPYPAELPETFNGKPCFTITTDRTVWDNAAAAWHAAHPPTLPDVAPPVVSMFKPGIIGSDTLTGTVTLIATAIDDRPGVSVQFKLDSVSIGAEQTSPTDYVGRDTLRNRDFTTKYQIIWNSTSVANATPTLRAVARDAAGHVTTSQGIAVTVNNQVSAGQSTVVAGQTSIPAGSGTSRITVTVKDSNGSPMTGVTVVLAATGSGNTLTQPAGPTDGNGVATGTLSSTVAEAKTVSATANGTAITQTATVTVIATITHTLLTAGNHTANQRIYTTAAIAPVPNRLVTVAVHEHSSLGTPPSPTLSGGGMSTWTEVASITFDTNAQPRRRVTIFRAMSVAPGSGALTITSSMTLSHCQWIVSQWDGVETSGTNGAGAIGQTGSSSSEAVPGVTVSLAPFGSANNVAYGVFGVASKALAVTPGAGFTEISEQPSGESTPGDLQGEWAVNDPTIDASWTSRNAGALGVEIKARPPISTVAGVPRP